MEEKIDRRKQRTRRMLKDALIGLILERGYDDLTIQDITERADLRRATFYLHYTDREELLMAALQETFDALTHQVEHLRHGDSLAGKTDLESFRVTFQHAADNAGLYRIIFASSVGAAITRRIRDYLAALILGELRSAPGDSLAFPPDVLANFIAGSELSLITWWLEQGQPYSVEVMATMAQQLILDGARAAVTRT